MIFQSAAEMDAARPEAHDNLQADPRFAAAAGADLDPLTFDDNDLRLAPDSPAIDSGALPAAEQESLDLDGVARPLDGLLAGFKRMDVGAYEYYGVWLLEPHAPMALRRGDALHIRWKVSPLATGPAVRFELWAGGTRIAVLGVAPDSTGEGDVNLPIPLSLAPGGPYRLRGVCESDERLAGQADGLIYIDPRQSGAREWTRYE
jgi:hypothetical protein